MDAAAFCLALQEALLYQPWPGELLDQPETCTIVREADSSGKTEVLFRGLRIRMGMHTGVPSSITVSSSSRTVEYIGAHFACAKRVSDMGRGGQVIMTAQTFHALYGKLSLVGQLVKLNSLREEMESQRANLDTASLAAHCFRTTNDLDGGSSTFVSKRSRIIANKGASIASAESDCIPPRSISASDLVDNPERPKPSSRGGGQFNDMSEVQNSAVSPRGNAGSMSNKSANKQPQPCEEVDNDSADAKTQALNSLSGTAMSENSLPVVVDMGMLKKRGCEGARQNHLHEIMNAETTLPEDCAEPSSLLSVYQLLSPMLVQRLSLLTSMNIPSDMFQAKPSFFDAPGVSSSTFAQQTDFPEVTIAFCKLHKLDDILAGISGSAASEMMCTYREIVLQALDSTGGYLCQDRSGLLLVAFMTPTAAVSWALAVHISLLNCDWPQEVLQHKYSCVMYDDDDDDGGGSGQLLFRGPAPRIALLSGRVHQVAPHLATGRAEYFGPVVNTCARMFAVAQAGQTLTSTDTMKNVASPGKSLPGMVLVELHSIGKVSLKGVSDPVTLVDILPKQLFPRMRKRERLKSSTKAGVIECETQRIDPLNIVVPTAGILMELIKPMVHLKR